MVKDPNIYLKLEVTRDKISGDLNIIAHFDLNAPNVFLDEKGYFWLPTEEEKDLLGDSFELMPSAKAKPSLEKMEIQSTPRPEIKQEPEIQQKTEFTKPSQPIPTPEPKQEPGIQQKTEFTKPSQPIPTPEPKQEPGIQQKTEFTKPSQPAPTPEQKPVSESKFELEKKEYPLPPLEKPQDETAFGITEKAISDETEKQEETKDENTEETKEKDEGMIVKADSDAIEKALKKHTEEKDESMVEADERTIVDKVLKQKKKWKK